jgi:LemA protein
MTVLLILLVLVVLVVLALVLLYNNLVRLRNRIEGAWAQIDVQLKRRYDLIPNLVETVKGYASHEKETLDAVVRARNAAGAASGPGRPGPGRDPGDGGPAPGLRALRGLPRPQGEPGLPAAPGGAGRDRGPDLLRPAVLQRHRAPLQHQDPDLPGVLIANAMRFQEREYFEADDTSRGPVQVQF